MVLHVAGFVFLQLDHFASTPAVKAVVLIGWEECDVVHAWHGLLHVVLLVLLNVTVACVGCMACNCVVRHRMLGCRLPHAGLHADCYVLCHCRPTS